MTEPQTASPELQLFFDKLLAVKKHCRNGIESEGFYCDSCEVYEEIYNMLDDIIKDERTGDTHV